MSHYETYYGDRSLNLHIYLLAPQHLRRCGPWSSARDALRLELSWTLYRRLLRVDNEKARKGYVDDAAEQNWSSRRPEDYLRQLPAKVRRQ
ncbi:hypothetical protein GVN18_09755 [Pseudomonas sp. ODNR1LW]|nr:hypothetical protein [Pseudomonas sp. ODNR1LW]